MSGSPLYSFTARCMPSAAVRDFSPIMNAVMVRLEVPAEAAC